MKKAVYYCSLFTIYYSLISSCQEEKKYLTDTPTKGYINVVVDETYKPIMDSEKMVFESHYPEAKINLIYKPAMDAAKDFENDSVRVIISAIPIDSALMGPFFEKRGYYPKSIILAKDAVAIIANNSRKGIQISKNELAKICSGQMTDFSQLKHGKGAGKITLVFDHERSSTVQFLQDSVLNGQTVTSNAFALKSNEEVLKYVQKNSNAIGVIGANWISDNMDENTQNFSKSIYPIRISASEAAIYYYEPHAGYIATHLYPLRRYMHVTLKENGAALGRGFVNFIGGEIGQRIVLKSGIVPAKALTRVVETH